MTRPTLTTTVLDRMLVPALLSFTRLGYAWNAPGFSDLDSLEGRHVVLTGATSGLGLAASRQLAAIGASLTIVGRQRDRLHTLVEQLQAVSRGRIRGEVADLGNMTEVRALAARLQAHEEPIHVLINNAGAMFNDFGVTADGIERTLALNLLSPFLLTQLLMPRLTSSAPARIITVSSGGMYLAPLDVSALEHPEDYNGTWRYALTKRAQVVLGRLWAQELTGSGVDVFTMHPGWADTKGLRTAMPGFRRVTGPILRSAEQGADTIVYLASSRGLVGQGNGGFWLDRKRHPTQIVPWTREGDAARDALWHLLSRLTCYGAAGVGNAGNRPDAAETRRNP
jgi:dehydrogenase/reductase SDR family protein 12